VKKRISHTKEEKDTKKKDKRLLLEK